MAKRDQSPLTSYQQDILKQARAMKPGEPPHPWGNRLIVPAAGVLAGGWDKNDNIILISSDGYSLTNPASGERLIRNRDSEITFKSISSGYLDFKIPDNGEEIRIFGLNAGDGTHITQDGWILEVIYPWWPLDVVIIKTPFVVGSGLHAYLDRAHMIKLLRLDGWLKCGFSPSDKYFVVLGSGGAEIFSRQTHTL